MYNIKSLLISSFLLFFLVFASCKVGQKYEQPEMAEMPDSFDELAKSGKSVSEIGWSTLYSDPVLKELIHKALEHNKDIMIATARIKEMAASKRISFANLFPGADLNIGGERKFENQGGDNKKYSSKFKTNIGVSWELDIWGNLRWANDASVASYMQTIEARRALQLTIIAEVAATYFQLEALDRELEIVKQTLDARQEAVRFSKLRYEGGLTSEIPYHQSLVEFAKAETLIPSLENEIKLIESDLFLLIGEFPSGEIPRSHTFDKHMILDELPIDLPSDLLRRRPDMLQAEQKLIQTNAEVGVAYTDMFPSLKLTARGGLENFELSQFFKSPAWLVDGLVTGPLFNMGKNKAKHNAAKARYEQEIYAYEKKVLSVFQEVNNSIDGFHKIKEVRASREKLYESVEAYHKLARLQYINGMVTNMEVLDSQRLLFDAEISLNEAKLKELLSVVMLYKALGGGLKE